MAERGSRPEELSPKKQLPLRKQVQKAKLITTSSPNNSTSPAKIIGPKSGITSPSASPIQLFRASDVISLHANNNCAPYQDLFGNGMSVGSVSSFMLPSGKLISVPFKGSTNTLISGSVTSTASRTRPNSASTVCRGLAHQQTTPDATSSTSSANRAGHTNPYARPLSAKDITRVIVGPSNCSSFSQSLAGPSAHNSAVNSHPSNFILTNSSVISSSSNSINCTASSTIHVQTNSFMRPRSALRPRSSSVDATKKVTRHNSISDFSSHATNTTVMDNNSTRVISKTAAHSVSTCPSPVKAIHLSSKTPDSVNVNPVGKPPMGPNTAPNKAHVPHPPSHASTMPGNKFPTTSAAGNVSPGPTSKLTSHVRNPDYSPGKPYSEVTNETEYRCSSNATLSKPLSASYVASRRTDSGVGSCSSTSSTTTLSSAPSSTSSTPLMSSNGSLDSVSSDGGISNCTKVSMTHSKSAPTSPTKASVVCITKPLMNYYRKSSRSEELIDDGVSEGGGVSRPKTEGAPAKNGLLEIKNVPEYTGNDVSPEKAVRGVEDDLASLDGERQPGDGEASSCDELDDNDDGIDGLDDDKCDCFDGESDGLSLASTSTCTSRQSSAGIVRAQSARPIRIVSTVKDISPVSTGTPPQKKYIRPKSTHFSGTTHPPFSKSLFPNRPPTVNFVAEDDRVEPLPWEMRRFLKWRLSPITPNIVKAVLARVGFRITKRNHDWLGCWGKHMKAQGFKAIRDYQKLNHFPGSFQIGRKDRLWRNLVRMQVHFGKREFNFFPQTYVLPHDIKLLKRAWEDSANKQKWIMKPPASARGIGIKLVHKWNQIPRRKPVIIQKYLSRPYLINDSKFDLRVYVYVSSFDPLRIYVFDDGLVRFASCKYSNAMKNIGNKYMHLTNYSINKKNADYESNGDETQCQGHKWSLKSLWTYLRKLDINTNKLWDSIKDLIVKTIISSESAINSMTKLNVKSRYCVHELFGFDILLDDTLKPWILEVNISPSLHSNSQLDINIKGNMIKDLFNMAGYQIPDKCDIVINPSNTSPDLSKYVLPNGYCQDKRLFNSLVSPDERAKHAYYCQRHQDEQAMQSILDILTPDDIRLLTESIDEDARRGAFQRVFPTPTSHKYLRFFEQPRYYNLLLARWIQRYYRMEQKGIALLESYCAVNVHLAVNADLVSHQWSPPSLSILSYREPRITMPNGKHSDGDVNTRMGIILSHLPKMMVKKSSSAGMAGNNESPTKIRNSVTVKPAGRPSRLSSAASATTTTDTADSR